MSPAILSAAALFGLVTSITPGPNNMMLLASGLNFGVRRSLPHLLGISVGYVVLMLTVGFGLGEAFRAVPNAFLAIKIAGGAYMLWLAWRIATSASPKRATAEHDEAKLVPAIGIWAAFGASLRRFLSNPRWRRAFNVTMALLLVASLRPLFAAAI